MKKAILFDLDGTLLPMDNDEFTRLYVGLLSNASKAWGYIPEEMVKGLWQGTGVMMKNGGGESNEAVFWKAFSTFISNKTYEEIMADGPLFEEFYHGDFHRAKSSTWENPHAAKMLEAARKGGRKVILATSPIFPPSAIEARLGWTGLSPADFDYITTYDNSSFCKPNHLYFTEIMEKNGLRPEECAVVGNNVDEDILPSIKAGIDPVLCTDCLINRSNTDISGFVHGTFEEMIKRVEEI